MKALVLHRSTSKLSVIAAIPLKNIIHSIKFTQREFSTWSDNDDKIDDQFNLFYQRPINAERLKSIKKYITDSLFNNMNQEVLFPTSILMGIDVLENDFVEHEDRLIDITFLKNRNDILVVDGQHRMKALQELYDETTMSEDNRIILGDLKLNCTILINYDVWDQARIFADVNFKQKPVDKSLYYDIFGEFYDDKKSNNILYIAHQLGKFLNQDDKSPLKGFVKNFNTKLGFVSQAFITTSLMNLLGPRGVWNYIGNNFIDNPSYKNSVPNVMVGYFNVIKKQFDNYWPTDLKPSNSTILTKTTALGALVKLLGLIDDRLRKGLFPNFKQTDLIDLSVKEIEDVFTKVFTPFNTNTEEGKLLADKYFGEFSKYKGGGSVGLQSQLYKELANEIGIPIEKR